MAIASKSNTKFKTVAWGICFIALGLAMEVGMILLCLLEGFSVAYLAGCLLPSLFFFAGITSIHWRKYPLELLADDRGIHYFVYADRLGYHKKEVVVPWEAIATIERYQDADFDEDECENEAIVIQLLDNPDASPMLGLDDTGIDCDTVGELVAKLNVMRKLYT